MSLPISTRIVISYRRKDDAAYAGRLFDRLNQAFPQSVFMDIDKIRGGANFRAVITQAVAEAEILIAVIGPHWLSAVGPNGRPRIHDRRDLVRIEISTALRHGLRVVPVLVGGAALPNAADLPRDLVTLPDRQAHEVSDTRFHQDVDRLLVELGAVGGFFDPTRITTLTPPSRATDRLRIVLKRLAASAPSLRTLAVASFALIAISALGVIVFQFATPPPPPIPDTIRLVRPDDGAVFVHQAPVYEWNCDSAQTPDIQFEIERTTDDGRHRVARVVGTGFTETEFDGRLSWRVRSIINRDTGDVHRGPWSASRTIESYRSRLDKIKKKGSVHIGIAEGDELFVKVADGQPSGFEIELVKILFTDLIGASTGQVLLDHTFRVWGDDFFELLRQDQAIDLLVSGISIREDRERKYGFKFTDPYVRYPQAFVYRGDDAKDLQHIGKVGVARNTTNETFVCDHLVGQCPHDRVVPIGGSNSYTALMNQLLDGKLDTVVMDRPYAKRYIALFRSRAPDLRYREIDAEIVQDPPEEKIGMAVRGSDSDLLQNINSWLRRNPSRVDQLRQRFLPDVTSR